ncbi:hypothetical protein [Enterovirga sp. CN4-39]|uniref:hypothetical protein n=1 Tax=Enterovirga sp. CN4-39 TaxID=3400910 RepID=UPI003C04C8B1
MTAIARAVQRYHAAEADHAEVRQEQEVSRRAARLAQKRASSARAAKLEAIVTLAMTPAESLDDIIRKARLVQEALGDERALATRIVGAEGMPAADRLALAVALDLLQLAARDTLRPIEGAEAGGKATRWLPV